MDNWDFSGWATKNNLECGDGRVICEGAFSVQDGTVVPLVYNHSHDDITNVLGNVILENRPEGVYAYGYFNDNENSKTAKECVQHGDITSMSICANDLIQDGPYVKKGTIREVSLVIGGSNPGARIESTLQHGTPLADFDSEGILYTGEKFVLNKDFKTEAEGSVINHSSDSKTEEKDPETKEDDKKEELKDDKTIKEILDGMTEEQLDVTYGLIKQAMIKGAEDAVNLAGEKVEDEKEDDFSSKNKEGEVMKHNVFSDSDNGATMITHSDMKKVIEDAQRIGSFKEALKQNYENGMISHSIDSDGMETATGHSTYGINDPEMLFPEFHNLNPTPEFISRNMDWVSIVMSGVRRTPFSRIKSQYADITEDDARARGYIKGKEKKTEVFSLLKRTTTPQTVYKLQKLDRDDISDITDFDVVMWIKGEMRMMLNEEIARAILIGDGRDNSSDDHISEDHIRPIVTDKPLYNTKVDVKYSSDADVKEKSKAIITAAIKSRKNYKGSGNPVLFTTEDVLSDLLLLEDEIGHRLYKTEAELATAMRVSRIITVEVLENHKVDEKNLLGVIVNLSDYVVGADKGGAINTFDDFDIKFNQYLYLIETRISGALVRPYSAITLLANPQ